MTYVQIVNLIINILWVIFGLCTIHYIVFAIIGIFKTKKYPVTDKKYKYGLIIPARNEEKVVSGLIESIQKNNYPQDKLHIFVIAHNCSDNTAAIARKLGATVYEYNNPEENTMGYAFRHLFECIERDYGTQNYDGFFLFNADNILDKDYFSRMNDAFEYHNKECIITSFRNSKNFGTNIISGLYGMYFAVGCRLESRGRTVCGCSTRVQGCGYLVNSKLVKDGWKYVTLAEDWEFTADQVLLESKIRYCDDAVFYDEQPLSFRIMWRQRVRWSRGHLIVFYTRAKDLFRSLFKKDTERRGSVYDITINVLPITLIFMLLNIVQLILLLIAPLVDSSASISQLMLGDTTNLFKSTGLLLIWLKSFIFSYFTLVLNAIVVFVIERKRIKNVSFLHKVLITLTWPLFIAIQLPMDVQAFFSRKLTWKPIPHSDQTSFDHVNKQ